MKFAGHDFRNEQLLAEALTTPSYRMDYPDAADNQRLEFLGDAVLGFLAARKLYGSLPDEAEGVLTVRRTHMVSTVALCAAADRLGLVPSLRQSSHASPLSKNSKTIADAVEALIGAAYLDGGFDAAGTVFDTLMLSEYAEKSACSANPKGELQERAQAMKPPRRPVYTLVSAAGKAHEPIFTVRVSLEGVGEATATARTHREAESIAAARMLDDFRNCVL